MKGRVLLSHFMSTQCPFCFVFLKINLAVYNAKATHLNTVSVDAP